MHQLPIIRETGDFAGRCEKSGGLKQLDRIHRTLPIPRRNTADQEVLQDETGFAVNDQLNDSFIFDDYKDPQ